MFERYTERARRVLFFARYEASQLGGLSIETEHMLLGLLREGKGMTSQLFARSHVSLEGIRQEIERRTVFHEKVSTAVEIPFSVGTKRILQHAAEEADRLLHTHIGTEHLLLGILREEGSIAGSILIEKGMRLQTVREHIVALQADRTADDELSGRIDAAITRHRPGPTRDFVPSYDVHFMYSHSEGTTSVGGPREYSLGGFTLKAAIARLWEIDGSRIELPPALATDQRYDIVVKLPRDEPPETIHTLVRQAIEKQFDVQVASESRSTDVYVITMPGGAGPALRSQPDSQGGGVGFGSFSASMVSGAPHDMSIFPMERVSFSGMPTTLLATALEEILGRPVVDETGLTGIHDLELSGSIQNRDALVRALRDKAGLVVTPARRDIQVLVVRQR